VIYGIKAITKFSPGTDRAHRNFADYPDASFLVSDPRSSNTWTHLSNNEESPGRWQ
jgi:hypothetical protein